MEKRRKVLIIGDTILDRDVYLEAIGLSLESPTVKTRFLSETVSYGGAANVARFSSRCGADTTFITAADESVCRELNGKWGVRTLSPINCTAGSKTRYYVRKGDETYRYLQINTDASGCQVAEIVRELREEHFDAVAISDYRNGVVTQDVIQYARELRTVLYAASQVSDRGPNFEQFHSADFIVCNKSESQHVGRDHDVFVTNGKDGCEINGRKYPSPVVVQKRTIGAGDAFFAALLATNDPEMANRFAAQYVSGELR